MYNFALKPLLKKLTVPGSYLLLLFIRMLHKTCSFNWINDPRPSLKKNNINYCYATLHSHQISFIMQGEPQSGALVSASPSGKLLMPLLKSYEMIPIKGSTDRKHKKKSGAVGLKKFINHSLSHKPTYFAIDGPIGPRGYVNRGISHLARVTKNEILSCIAVPTKRWYLNTWDRIQIPKPFSTINYYVQVIKVDTDDTENSLRKKIHLSLAELEKTYDPVEYENGLKISEKYAKKLNQTFDYLNP